MTPTASRALKQGRRAALVILSKAFGLLARILPYRAAVALGAAIGSVAYLLLPRDRKRTISHLSLCYPDRDPAWVARTSRGVFIHLGKALFEVLAMSKRRLGEVVSIDGLENLVSALEQKKGVVYFTGHIGNWELMAARIARLYPVSVVAAPIKPETVNDLIVGLRASMGVRTILRDRPGAAKELIRVFRENRLLGLLIDQDTDVEGAFVEFFGRPAWTPTAAASMAIKFNAPVVFGFIHRDGPYRHRISIEGPLELVRTGNAERDIIENTALFTRKIEAAVARYPEQWVWMHRRWRRQP